MTTAVSELAPERLRDVGELPADLLNCIVHGKPDPALRDYVLGYAGLPPRTPLPPVARFLPMNTVPLMLEFGPAPAQLIAGDRRFRLPAQPVVGLHDHAVVVELRPAHGLTIMLTPPGAHALFGVCLREVANTFTGAAELLGDRIPLLAEQLAAIGGWPGRFALLDRTLSGWLAQGRAPAAAITRAWWRLRETRGRLRIADLAAEIGTSRRYLEKRFDEQIGLSPKTVARIMRLRSAASMLTATSLADVASACGYSDHAHLARDFREIAGCTPSEYLARRANPNPVGRRC